MPYGLDRKVFKINVDGNKKTSKRKILCVCLLNKVLKFSQLVQKC